MWNRLDGVGVFYICVNFKRQLIQNITKFLL